MTPAPLWQLMESFYHSFGCKSPLPERGGEFREVGHEGRCYRCELAAALRAWDEWLASKGEHNDSLREQILGVPPKEPASKPKELGSHSRLLSDTESRQVVEPKPDVIP